MDRNCDAEPLETLPDPKTPVFGAKMTKTDPKTPRPGPQDPETPQKSRKRQVQRVPAVRDSRLGRPMNRGQTKSHGGGVSGNEIRERRQEFNEINRIGVGES